MWVEYIYIYCIVNHSAVYLPDSYLFRDPSDQTVAPSVSVTIENVPIEVILVLGDLDGLSDQFGQFSHYFQW